MKSFIFAFIAFCTLTYAAFANAATLCERNITQQLLAQNQTPTKFSLNTVLSYGGVTHVIAVGDNSVSQICDIIEQQRSASTETKYETARAEADKLRIQLDDKTKDDQNNPFILHWFGFVIYDWVISTLGVSSLLLFIRDRFRRR